MSGISVHSSFALELSLIAVCGGALARAFDLHNYMIHGPALLQPYHIAFAVGALVGLHSARDRLMGWAQPKNDCCSDAQRQAGDGCRKHKVTYLGAAHAIAIAAFSVILQWWLGSYTLGLAIIATTIGSGLVARGIRALEGSEVPRWKAHNSGAINVIPN